MNDKMGPYITVTDLHVTTSPHTTSPLGGDPVLVDGDLPGTAVDSKDAVTGLTPVMVADHVHPFVVGGVKSGGNAAISAGDKVYIQSDGTLNGDSGGKFFGRAFGNDLDSSPIGTDTRTGQLVASGVLTTTIRVWVGKV